MWVDLEERGARAVQREAVQIGGRAGNIGMGVGSTSTRQPCSMGPPRVSIVMGARHLSSIEAAAYQMSSQTDSATPAAAYHSTWLGNHSSLPQHTTSRHQPPTQKIMQP